MARYIDMDLLKEMIEAKADTVINAKQQFHYVAGWLDHLPPADVVPKSEVEQLKRNLEQCENGYSQALHLERCKLADEQSKVREIFKEMQSCLIQRHWNGLDIVSFEFDAVKYAELKKKYTESEDK